MVLFMLVEAGELVTVMTLWLEVFFSFSDVSWEVAVMSVVEVVSSAEDSWVIESIEFIVGLVHVVFNTITICIIYGSHWGCLLVVTVMFLMKLLSELLSGNE